MEPQNAETVDPEEYDCEGCGETFPTLESLDSHRVCCYKVGYSCDSCDKTFPSLEDLDTHRVYCTEQRFSCDACGKDFSTLELLDQHRVYSCSGERYGCDACGADFPSLEELDSHRVHCKGTEQGTVNHFKTVKNEHVPDDSDDDDEEEIEGNVRAAIEKSPNGQIKTETSGQNKNAGPHGAANKNEESQCVCPICNTIFQAVELLETHMESHQSPADPFCAFCKKSFKNLDLLAEHACADKSYRCEICSKDYKHESTYKTHMEKEHGELAVYECYECGKEFLSAKARSKHMSTHNTDKPHPCEICGKCFKRAVDLREHVNAHLDIRKYQCHICEKSFARSSCLSYHLRFVHEKLKVYTCEVCGRKTGTLTSFKDHMLQHQDAKNHMCSICGKAFKRARTLKKHLIIHTGEKPYLCPTCGKGFADRSNLKQHTYIHSSKTHKCHVCNKEFSVRRNLKRHCWKAHGVMLENQTETEDGAPALPPTVSSSLAPMGPVVVNSSHAQYAEHYNREMPINLAADVAHHDESQGSNITDMTGHNESTVTTIGSLNDTVTHASSVSHNAVYANTNGAYVNASAHQNNMYTDSIARMSHSYAIQERSTEMPIAHSTEMAVARNTEMQVERSTEMPIDYNVKQYSVEQHTVMPVSELQTPTLHTVEPVPLSRYSADEKTHSAQPVTETASPKDTSMNSDLNTTNDAYSDIDEGVPMENDDVSSDDSFQLNEELKSNFICRECGDEFPSKSDLKYHKKLHKRKSQKCPTCKKEFENVQSLRTHVCTNKSYECEFCDKKYKYEHTYKTHMEQEHGQLAVYECYECGQEFLSAKARTKHMETHGIEKPHECEICGKGFKRAVDLREHVNAHLDIRKYKCNQCDKSFARHSCLSYHLKYVHEKCKNFECNVCGKKCGTSTSFKDHMLLHDDLKQHICNVCGKAFKRARTLKKHLIIHTGEKPYQCDTCGKGFADPSNLKQHKRIHSNIRHGCTICDKSFTQLRYLRKHTLTDHGIAVANENIGFLTATG